MIEENQRLIIAEYCGWKNLMFRGIFEPKHEDWIGEHESCIPPNMTGKWTGPLPNYTKDLNAMNQAEMNLPNEEIKRLYVSNLVSLMKEGEFTVMAPSYLRSEAFVKTIGKWE
jgi:hypothetical protein